MYGVGCRVEVQRLAFGDLVKALAGEERSAKSPSAHLRRRIHEFRLEQRYSSRESNREEEEDNLVQTLDGEENRAQARKVAVLPFSQPEKVPDHQRGSTGVTYFSLPIQCRFESRKLCFSQSEKVPAACVLRVYGVECGV